MSHEQRNSKQSSQEDLQWLAFCYVADELTDVERDEFELRLEDDHAAREAVVTAMEQAEQIWLACDSPASQAKELAKRTSATRPNRRFSHAGALLVSAAALLLMVAGWGWYANQPTPSNTGLSESENLAVVLAELVEEARDNYVADEYVTDGFDEIEFDDEEIYAEDELSDWMFVALTDEDAEFEGAE